MLRTPCSRLAIAVAAFAILAASPAAAISFSPFSCITNNSAGDCTIGTNQLSAEIVQSGADALLTLTMTGPDDGVVEQLFIESSLASGISFGSSVGVGDVAFGTGQVGGNLPGGTNVGFVEAFNISASNPAPRRGIGRHDQDDTSPQSGTFLITFTGGDFQAFVDDLRIGVHVIGYESGGSEAFLSSAVPEPGTLSLIAVGLAGLGMHRRARR